jgi:hypothetical protein
VYQENASPANLGSFYTWAVAAMPFSASITWLSYLMMLESYCVCMFDLPGGDSVVSVIPFGNLGDATMEEYWNAHESGFFRSRCSRLLSVPGIWILFTR